MSGEHETSTAGVRSLKVAVNLLWASLAVGGLKIAFDFLWISNLAPAWFTNFVMLFTILLNVLFIWKIASGKNWARITYLVLLALGVLPTIPTVLGEFGRLPIVGMLSVVQLTLQAYALILLFRRPASECFKKRVAS